MGGPSFDAWLDAVFDPDAEDPHPDPETDVAHLTRLLADPVAAVGELPDDRLGRGLWSIADSGGAGTVLALDEPTVPLEDRLACIRSLTTLYRELFAPRCTPLLGHLSEEGTMLEAVLYMWWDIAAFGGPPDSRDGNLVEDAVLDVLDDALRIDHAGCQESALHGLGHRRSRHPERVPRLLDAYLRRGAVADERLVRYAEAARTGCIL